MVEAHKRERSAKGYAALVGRGFAMGSADVVPGVSGGTMALILGIYERLITEIGRLSKRSFLMPLSRLRIGEALEAVDWRFLASVLSGILLAVFTLAPFFEWALEHHPELVWALFFGLVLASIITVGRRLASWSVTNVAAAMAAAVVAYLTIGLVPLDTPEASWFVFLCGSIAICAMVLPGVSGSFILVLLGKYQYVLGAVTRLDFGVLLVFALGAGIGMLAFVRLLSWLLRRYRDLTMAVLLGLMAGSLRKVWPWKQVVETALDRHGQPFPIVELNVLPVLGIDVVAAVALAVLGFSLVVTLERLSERD